LGRSFLNTPYVNSSVTRVLPHRRLWIGSLMVGGDRINSNQPAFERRSYLDSRWRLQLLWRVAA